MLNNAQWIALNIMLARLNVLNAFEEAVYVHREMTIIAYTGSGRIIPWKHYPSMILC